MANRRVKVLQGLLSLKLCPVGRRLMNDSFAPGGGGPAAFEPHMTACEQCRDEMDGLIDRLVNEWFPK